MPALGDTREAAIAETLCRDLRFDGTPRVVPTIMLRNKLLTALDVLDDIPVAALHGPHLAAVGQDLWLTKSEAGDYPLTRRWAAAILEAAPVDGLAYRCRHDNDRFVWMRTAEPGRHIHPALAETGEHVPLDTHAGVALIDTILARYNAALSAPH